MSVVRIRTRESYVSRFKVRWMLGETISAIRARRWARVDAFTNDMRLRGHEVRVGRWHLVLDGQVIEVPREDGIPWYFKETL
jgi:hypothetical protein